jgi:hypothetical protein
MITEEAIKLIATLQYDVAWLEYGFLDALTLSAQFAAFQSGDDQNTEHYRYATFRRALTTRSSLDAQTLSHYLHLAEIDPNPGMANAALYDLLVWDGLTQAQFEELSEHALFALPIFERPILIRRLLRKLQAEVVTGDVFEAFVACGDAALQSALLSHSALTEEQLESLSKLGVNRRVRNLARTRQRRQQNLSRLSTREETP